MVFLFTISLQKQKQNDMKTKLFKMAWAIRSQFETFADALKQAWRVIRLYAQMLIGNVKFQYRKVDGSIRDAVGTLSVAYESKGTGKVTPIDSIVYYDCEALGMRSFKIANLI